MDNFKESVANIFLSLQNINGNSGLGVEVLKGEGGSEVLKIWIHIADGEF